MSLSVRINALAERSEAEALAVLLQIWTKIEAKINALPSSEVRQKLLHTTCIYICTFWIFFFGSETESDVVFAILLNPGSKNRKKPSKIWNFSKIDFFLKIDNFWKLKIFKPGRGAHVLWSNWVCWQSFRVSFSWFDPTGLVRKFEKKISNKMSIFENLYIILIFFCLNKRIWPFAFTPFPLEAIWLCQGLVYICTHIISELSTHFFSNWNDFGRGRRG